MQDQGKLLTGLVLGAGVMYLLDPDRGARRRGLVRDKGIHAGRVLGDRVGAAARDVRNRSAGLAATAGARFRSDEAGDEVIQERVRAALGRAVSHPGAINTAVVDGRVFLSGPVLADEVDELLATVERVRGVRELENQLHVHEHGEQVPGLQGESRPRGQDAWPPAVRLLLGGGLALVGIGLLSQAASGRGRRSRSLAGRRGIEIQKTVTVAAPVEQVWALWSDFENFPRFMAHLREVRRQPDGRSHWVAAGPAGIPVQWEAVTTESQPNEVIAWQSVEGSTVDNAGRVGFRRLGPARTRIDIRLSYQPPAGAVGHAVASLFGADPKRALDEDIVRLKSLLEQGKTTAHGEQVRLDELEERQETAQPW